MNPYSENALIRDPAGSILHDELGWNVVYAYGKETFGPDGTLGRASRHEVLLTRYVRQALQRLNPWLEAAQIDEALQKLQQGIATDSLLERNRKYYYLIRDGVPVTVHKADGTTDLRRARLIDFSQPEANDFLAVKELEIESEAYSRRADLVGFVNGLPLVFMEFKNTTVDLENAYTDNYCDYHDTVPQLFYYNAFIIFSNGNESRIGTLDSAYEFFGEWKRLREEDVGDVTLTTMLHGICKKENLLDLFENFILYDVRESGTSKILAHNHQYLGVNEAFAAYEERKLRNGKLGVFWHTQGSGKSYSMIFLAKKIRRKAKGSPTIVVLTDRDELNTQIAENFSTCGLLEGKADDYIASSGQDLLAKLKGNPSFIFSLIQKFNHPDAEPIYPDHDVLLMSDEAHRSQNGVFAENMCHLLPTASRIGFTGTPIFANDNLTERTFGGYISIYDFHRAVVDGATVPLYYENRGAKILHLKNPKITQDILDAIDAANLKIEEKEKVEKQLENQVHVLMARPRLESIAKDFVRHYSELWTSGKAMFVCLNRITCIMMYDLVQKYWQDEIDRQEDILQQCRSQQEALELQRKIKWLKETKMAVVISSEQNEQKTFAKWGLDILPHRLKMVREDLAAEFKDKRNPFRIVFVCAMWLTGFDVKCLSCLYLDKPMKAHTLMQAIARANRVSEGKENGLIIDYVGILQALRKALAAYTRDANGDDGTDPVIDKQKLIDRIVKLIKTTEAWLAKQGFSLQRLILASNAKKIALLKDGADTVCTNDITRKEFSAYAAELARLVKYVNQGELNDEQQAAKAAILAIYRNIQAKRKHVDTTDVMKTVHDIISENVEMDAVQEETMRFDISKIDFSLLQKEFQKVKRKHLLLKDMREYIEEKLKVMLEVNAAPVRTDFFKRYEKIIQDYNDEKDKTAIEKLFQELMDLTKDMSQEERRCQREGFENEEQLAVYDLITKENLTKKDIADIKKISKEVLEDVKQKIAGLDHWKDKEETREIISIAIRDRLWNELPESYDDQSIGSYRDKLFDYFYHRY